MKIKLNKPFAADAPVDAFDVKQVKKALNRLGYYMPLKETGITGIPDRAVFNALKKFQADQDLPVTGEMRPGDQTLDALEKLGGAPTGPGSFAGLAGVGIGVGAKAGRFVEELGDAINPNSETDISLGFKKQKLLKEIKKLKQSVAILSQRINNVLNPKVQKERKEAEAAKNIYLKCIAESKE